MKRHYRKTKWIATILMLMVITLQLLIGKSCGVTGLRAWTWGIGATVLCYLLMMLVAYYDYRWFSRQPKY